MLCSHAIIIFAGEQTDYGDYNLLVLEHLAATAGQPRPIDLQELVPFWLEKLRSWRSWICTQTRQTVQQVSALFEVLCPECILFVIKLQALPSSMLPPTVAHDVALLRFSGPGRRAIKPAGRQLQRNGHQIRCSLRVLQQGGGRRPGRAHIHVHTSRADRQGGRGVLCEGDLPCHPLRALPRGRH